MPLAEENDLMVTKSLGLFSSSGDSVQSSLGGEIVPFYFLRISAVFYFADRGGLPNEGRQL